MSHKYMQVIQVMPAFKLFFFWNRDWRSQFCPKCLQWDTVFLPTPKKQKVVTIFNFTVCTFTNGEVHTGSVSNPSLFPLRQGGDGWLNLEINLPTLFLLYLCNSILRICFWHHGNPQIIFHFNSFWYILTCSLCIYIQILVLDFGLNDYYGEDII